MATFQVYNCILSIKLYLVLCNFVVNSIFVISITDI